MATKVKWRGVTVDARTGEMLQELARTSGRIYINPTQGSYSTGVTASAGTHAGGGAVDVMHSSWSTADYGTVEMLARQIGFAAWHRTPAQGNWSRHVHMLAVQSGGRGDQGVLSASADTQVKAYYDGRNGLANGARDTGTRAFVGVTWEKYLASVEGRFASEGTSTVGSSWHDFSGKPSGTLIVPRGRKVLLDVRTGDPQIAGMESHLVYLHCDITWDVPDLGERLRAFTPSAALRVSYVRDPYGNKPKDPTAYQDFDISPAYPRDDFLITHFHREVGELRRGGVWALDLHRDSGASKLTVTTRYAKADSGVVIG